MKLIIDVGCNVLEGFKKLNLQENITDNDRKIFVEANPECWDYLEMMVPSISNARLIKRALDIKKRKVQLITRADKRADVAATILGETFLLDSLRRWNIEINEYNSYEVETITLSDIINEEKKDCEKIVLKLDAEGIEYDVIRQIIEEDIPIDVIFCEFHIHNDHQNQVHTDLVEKLNQKNIKFSYWD
jgi:FkbM family methyltransferase